jgi:CHAD domain-containing protein
MLGTCTQMSSRSYRLKASERPGAGMRRIAAGRAERALERLAEADGGELGEAIHAARKDLKKLRGALRLVRDQLGDELFRAENHRYRDAGRLLAKSRDAQAKLETLDALQASSGWAFPAAEGWSWRLALRRDRDEIADLDSDETLQRVEQASAAIKGGWYRISAWSPESDSWGLVEAGLTRSYRNGREAMRRVQAGGDDTDVHEWRKRAKDLWYQLRILRDAWPELLEASADQVHRLTELLGDHHDLSVLGEDLRSRERIRGREAFEALIERRQAELAEQALRLGGLIYAEKPKAFRRRQRAYWRAWRGG